MSYSEIEQILVETVDRLVAAGASRKLVERAIGPVEVVAVNSVAENKRDQLLLDLDYSSADLATRFGCSERTIRNWRQDAIDRKVIAGTVAA